MSVCGIGPDSCADSAEHSRSQESVVARQPRIEQQREAAQWVPEDMSITDDIFDVASELEGGDLEETFNDICAYITKLETVYRNLKWKAGRDEKRIAELEQTLAKRRRKNKGPRVSKSGAGR